MNGLLSLGGVIVIGFTLVDIAMTTVSIQGAGPVSSRLMQAMWLIFLRAHGRRRSHRMLAKAGVCITASGVLVWVLLLWGGWSLIFMGSDGAIIESGTGEQAGYWATVYYSGFTLFTLGLGDYRPDSAPWQIMTAVCAANGLLTITLAVTYLVPVASAAVEKRQLAGLISSLGSSPIGILRRHRTDGGSEVLRNAMLQLHPRIIKQAQQHLAYPTLHYFHSEHAETALPVRLAAVDELVGALLASESGRAPHVDDALLLQTRAAISLFLQTLRSGHIEPADQAPPCWQPEGEAAIGVGPDDADALELRRRLLRGYVENDGWSWDDVTVAAVPEVVA